MDFPMRNKNNKISLAIIVSLIVRALNFKYLCIHVTKVGTDGKIKIDSRVSQVL